MRARIDPFGPTVSLFGLKRRQKVAARDHVRRRIFRNVECRRAAPPTEEIPLKSFALALALTAVTVSFPLQAASLSVSGQANIFAAGQAAVTQPGGGGGGVLPSLFTFAAGAGQSVTFSSVTGFTNCCNGAPTTGPDGDAPGTNILPANGLSGIAASSLMFLAGVFLDDAVPGGPGPATLDFTGNTAFASLSPLLGQLFFIGDGRTGTGAGAFQQFNAPATATRLYLGVADALGFGGQHGFYVDNSGAYEAIFALSGGNPNSSVIPVPAALPLLLSGLGVFGWLARRRSV
ncbi:MAG: VPLPA-CTERM sorting domain-containing protein [Proteobacteria bacterium]|nr:VPLPA-CTERM sorting domain-containing protein [Burkholderiales bacterium]